MKIFIIRVVTLILFIINSIATVAAKPVDDLACSFEDSKMIKQAISVYLNDQKNSVIAANQWDIYPQRCLSNYALATIHPKKPVTDDAFIYLQKVKSGWKIIMSGTHFDDDFLQTIPKKLRDYPSVLGTQHN